MAFQPPWTISRRSCKRHALIWPKDGKRGTKLGRLADILTNSGPDIFVATRRNHHTPGQLWDSPSRGRWSRWDFLDAADPWNANLGIGGGGYGPHGEMGAMPWVSSRRGAAQKYDFCTRKWADGHPNMWSGVRWEQGAKTRDRNPIRFRTPDGLWWSPQVQQVGFNGGGGGLMGHLDPW